MAPAVLFPQRSKQMLKITSIDRNGQRTLVLEGRLADPWLTELEQTWNEVRQRKDERDLLIDLKDVTSISERGEVLLRQMMVEGAKFNCCRGVLTRHVVRRLIQACTALRKKRDVK
jgi:anti-anti-sigma regulatory factor